jgi:hypothetical protein
MVPCVQQHTAMTLQRDGCNQVTVALVRLSKVIVVRLERFCVHVVVCEDRYKVPVQLQRCTHTLISRFLLFDRKHVHRFLKELTNGNSLYADRYETSVDASHFLGESYTGVRAQWCKPALVDAASSPVRTTLFHRWLLRAILGTFIEHLNDIALDCRETNLRTSGSLLSNNAHIHRVKHALWKSGAHGACRLVQDICLSQRPYLEAVKR